MYEVFYYGTRGSLDVELPSLDDLFYNKKYMKKSTKSAKRVTKVATKKVTKKANPSPYSTTRVAPNIGKLPNGMYRARKSVDGVAYSRNFPKLKDARAWVSSL